MANDDDYVEGDASSAPADPPGAVPADDDRSAPVIDSSTTHDAPVTGQSRGAATARMQNARKALREAMAAAKVNPPEVKEEHEDPEDVALGEAEKPADRASEIAAKATEDKPAPVAAAAPADPPAPSLDPEVMKLRQALKDELAATQAARAKAEEKPAESPPTAVGYEDYLDNSPRAYRSWLESMRGEKFASDDDFKAEVHDFITQASADVLGVPLPKDVRNALDASLARKSVRSMRTLQAKKEAEATKKAEQARVEAEKRAADEAVEREWSNATSVFNKAYATGTVDGVDVKKDYPWLSVEDEPGRIIVEIIRKAMDKDGTRLSWQEASKKANDYLKSQNETHYSKRKALYSPQPAAATPAAKPAVKPAEPKPAEPPPARVVTEPKPWSRDGHLANTMAAFRKSIKDNPPPRE